VADEAVVVRFDRAGRESARSRPIRIVPSDMAVSDSGAVWIAGHVRSEGLVGRIDDVARGVAWAMRLAGVTGSGAAYSPTSDAFVAKISAGEIVSTSFLAGDNADFATGIAVLGPDRVVVVGNTRSSDWPTTPGSLRP
jgi:hypothetical protein